jgi:ABC-type polysaccharide/polyol phosphate export permease
MAWSLAVADFKMRDQGTIGGFIWTLLHPLIYFLVMYGLFVKWMGSNIPNFTLYLIIGFVQWNFFSAATTAAINVLMRYGTYIKSINFPKSVLVVSSVLSSLFIHLMEICVLIIFWLIVRGHLSFKIVLLLPVLLLNIYLVLSLSFVLATVGVYLLDVGRIWGILMSIGIFITPIFYSMNMLSPGKQRVILLNPMTHIIKATRQIMIDNIYPDIQGLIYVFLLATCVLVFGYALFKKKEGLFVEKIC